MAVHTVWLGAVLRSDGLAKVTSPAPGRTSTARRAERQRRYRQRQRRRETVYRVTGGDDVLMALLISGRLTEAQALNREVVEAELRDVLKEWAGRWRE